MKRGFTLLEVLLVIGILSIIGVMGVSYYRNAAKNVTFTTTIATLENNIKAARSKAMLGEGGTKWGIRFVNTSQDDYYEIYSTPTTYTDVAKEIESTIFVTSGVTFTDPVESTVKDVIFSRISGTTTPTTVSLISEAQTKIITITALGSVQ
jgi:prepilin-type N-terminal cleavage/methylation domain-containing protein